MTHKEEAINRVDKFYNIWEQYRGMFPKKESYKKAKQCALLAIDREIEVYRKFSEQIDRPVWIIEIELKEHFNHLEKVKQEIENL